MAEQVNIASLTIDVDDVIKESVRLQKEIDKLKASQKDLDRTTEEGAVAYAKNEAALKNLNKAYRDNQQFAAALDATNEDLNKTLEVQGKSTQELYDSRRQLNQIAKNIQGNTEEEIALREQLNTAIDAQTEALREQQSEFNAGKDQIGEYTKSINAADFNLKEFIVQSQDAGGATKLVGGGLKAATKSFIGFTKASLAFIATPVGLVLAAIAGAFLLIKNAMNRSEEATTKVKKAFAAFRGITATLLKFLQPLGDFLIDGLVAGFELVEKGIFKALEGIKKGLEFLGLDEAAESLGNFTEEVEKNVQASKELTEAELAYDKAQRETRKTQLLFQKDAEKLRQIRDDISKTDAERLKANDDLGKLLKKQGEDEAALAQKAVDLAKLRINLYGETKDNLDALADAETELIDIEERITGQTSEQLTNRNSLIKEFADKRKSEEEKAAQEAEEIEKARVEKSIELARFELNEYIRTNQAKLDSDKFFTDEALKEEERRLNGIAEKQREFAAKQLEEGVLTRQQYNEAIAQIDADNQAKIDEANLAREEAEKEKAAIDAENRMQLLDEQTQSDIEFQAAALEAERQAEVAAAEKTGADVALIEAKYFERRRKLQKATEDAQIDGFGQVFDSYASILGEQTAAGKAAAAASTLISTYQGAQNAYTSLAGIPIVGPGLGLVAAAAAVTAGLGNVAKIVGTPEKLATGGMVKGAGHGTSDSIPTLLSNGESVNNANSTRMFAPLYSYLNVLGGGKPFTRMASGGIAGSTSAPPMSIIDYDLLAASISEANANLPTPVVAVSEINEVDNGVKVVEDIATI